MPNVFQKLMAVAMALYMTSGMPTAGGGRAESARRGAIVCAPGDAGTLFPCVPRCELLSSNKVECKWDMDGTDGTDGTGGTGPFFEPGETGSRVDPARADESVVVLNAGGAAAGGSVPGTQPDAGVASTPHEYVVHEVAAPFVALVANAAWLWLVWFPAYHFYRWLPTWVGGHAGMSDVDICSSLTHVPASHWALPHSEPQCQTLIQRRVFVCISSIGACLYVMGIAYMFHFTMCRIATLPRTIIGTLTFTFTLCASSIYRAGFVAARYLSSHFCTRPPHARTRDPEKCTEPQHDAPRCEHAQSGCPAVPLEKLSSDEPALSSHARHHL